MDVAVDGAAASLAGGQHRQLVDVARRDRPAIERTLDDVAQQIVAGLLRVAGGLQFEAGGDGYVCQSPGSSPIVVTLTAGSGRWEDGALTAGLLAAARIGRCAVHCAGADSALCYLAIHPPRLHSTAKGGPFR